MNEFKGISVSVGDVFDSSIGNTSLKVFGYAAPKKGNMSKNYFPIETPEGGDGMFYASFIHRDAKEGTWENFFSKNDEKIVVVCDKKAAVEKAEDRKIKKIVFFVETNGPYIFSGVYVITDIVMSAEIDKVVFFYKRIATKYSRSAK